MPRPYSSDPRSRMIAACEEGERPSAVARRLQVARTSVCLWLQHWREERHCQAKRHRGGLKPVIRDKAEAALIRLVQADNDLILAEYRDRLAEETGVWVHPWIIGRVLHCLAWTSQKEDLACH